MGKTDAELQNLKMSQLTIIDKLNQNLPVQVTQYDIEHYPNFVKLLSSLTEHLGYQGVSHDLMKEVEETKETLKHEKYIWLQNHILYLELQQLLLEYEWKEVESGIKSPDIQFHSLVRESLTLSELGDYVECSQNPESETTLLGLTREEVHKRNPYKKHVNSIQQKLIPEIEDRIRHKCDSLVSFYEPTHLTENEEFTFAKSSQLPSFLEKDKMMLESERKYLRKDRNVRERQFWQYFQALTESLAILEELIKKHRLQSQTENDAVTSEWLMARCDGMSIKIKLVELQLLCDTYQAEAIAALKTINHHLDIGLHGSQVDLNKTKQALKAYESVDMGFNSLVQEYTKYQSEVENKRWALKELKQSLEKDV